VSLALADDRGDGPLVVLLHGFPELPHCWSAQQQPLADAGFRVVSPFMRGYGASPSPLDPQEYTADLLAADVVDLIEQCGAERAVLVGHDWGAQLTWWTAQLYPERVSALAALSVPLTRRSRTPPLQRLDEMFAGHFFYMLYFQEPGVAEREFATDPEGLLSAMYYSASGCAPPGATRLFPRVGTTLAETLTRPDTLPDWLPAEEFSDLVKTFRATGFTGALNHYRAMDRTWHRCPQLGELPVSCPALFVSGERDVVASFTSTAWMTETVARLRPPVLIPGAGHWVQREAAQQVTDALIEFLRAER
jgi:pimeloyl-ACP methyl ester carboxylesterase